MNARRAAETVVKQYVLLQPFLQANARDSFSSYCIFLTDGAFVISLIIFDKFRFSNDERMLKHIKSVKQLRSAVLMKLRKNFEKANKRNEERIACRRNIN